MVVRAPARARVRGAFVLLVVTLIREMFHFEGPDIIVIVHVELQADAEPLVFLAGKKGPVAFGPRLHDQRHMEKRGPWRLQPLVQLFQGATFPFFIEAELQLVRLAYAGHRFLQGDDSFWLTLSCAHHDGTKSVPASFVAAKIVLLRHLADLVHQLSEIRAPRESEIGHLILGVDDKHRVPRLDLRVIVTDVGAERWSNMIVAQVAHLLNDAHKWFSG